MAAGCEVTRWTANGTEFTLIASRPVAPPAGGVAWYEILCRW
jgi:hypothetical protein